MFTIEESRIVNLQDAYTIQYACLVRGLLDEFGIEGEAAAREGIRRYGVDRGTKSRNRHISLGVKVNMRSLFTIAPDLPADPRFRRERQELNPQERISHTLVCPMADVWKSMGEMDVGRMYCEEFHFACYNTYGFGLTQVNLAKTLTQEGDKYCSFNVILRPENMPAELRPLCFEEYDPGCIAPDLSRVPAPDAKKGFNSLWLRLYYHLLASAEDRLGPAGRLAISHGLSALAGNAASMLRTRASEYALALDADFVDRNYPLALDPDKEPLWDEYAGYGAKALLKQAFYSPFHSAHWDWA